MATLKNKTSEKVYALMNVPSMYSIDNSVSNKQTTNYMDYDSKMLAIAKDFVGSISDCFILYAIARLQFASRETIMRFLETLSAREPGFYIPEQERVGLDNRLKSLRKHGFIISVENEVAVENASNSKLVLFAVTEDGRTLANYRLQKRLKPDRFGSMRPLCEKVGMGASAYLTTKLMERDTFVDFAEAVFKGQYCGTIKLDNEIIFKKDDVREHVAIISFFMHQNKRYMDDKAFEDYKYLKLNTIRDYIITKSKRDGHVGKVICVCESQKDFDDMAKFIVASNGFNEEQLSCIYFTTQSVASSVKDIKNAFLQISVDGNDELIYSTGCSFL